MRRESESRPFAIGMPSSEARFAQLSLEHAAYVASRSRDTALSLTVDLRSSRMSLLANGVSSKESKVVSEWRKGEGQEESNQTHDEHDLSGIADRADIVKRLYSG